MSDGIDFDSILAQSPSQKPTTQDTPSSTDKGVDFDSILASSKPKSPSGGYLQDLKDTVKRDFAPAAAAGLGLAGDALGLGQVLASPSDTLTTKLQDLETKRRILANKVKSVYGKPGITNPASWAEFGGESLPFMLGGGEVAAGEKTIGLARSILQNVAKGSAIGFGAGAVSPTVQGESHLSNAAVGAIGGGLTQGTMGPVVDWLSGRIGVHPNIRTKAGEVFDNAHTPSTPEVTTQNAKIAEAGKTLNTPVPASADANPNSLRLNRELQKDPSSADALAAQHSQLIKQAGENLVTPDEKAVGEIRKTLNEYNDKIVAQNNEQIAKNKEQIAQVSEKAKKEHNQAVADTLSNIDNQIKSLSPGDHVPHDFGNRLREQVRSGKKDLTNFFNKFYNRFDEEKASSPSADFAERLGTFKLESADNGAILRDYVTVEDPITKQLLLDPPVAGKTGDKALEPPPDLTLKQWRGIKGGLYDASKRAYDSNQLNTARRLGELADYARQNELAAASNLKDGGAGYKVLTSAYDEMQNKAMGQGFPYKIRKQAPEGGYSLTGERVAGKLNNVAGADDLQRAMGAVKLAKKSGDNIPKNVTSDQLIALGKDDAAQMVLPYFQNQLAAVYKSAGGGKEGVTAARRWINNVDRQQVLARYGIDGYFNDLATKINDTHNILNSKVTAEAKTAVSNTVLGQVLKEVRPQEIAQHVFNSPDPKAELDKYLNVSKDPLWKSSVKTLFTDRLKNMIDNGKNVFSDPQLRHIREILPSIFDPHEIKILDSYNTYFHALNQSPPPATIDMPETSGAQKFLAKVLHTFGVWHFGPRAVKGGIETALKTMSEHNASEMLQYLSEAQLDPKKAELLVNAYKGSPYYKQKLVNDIKEYIPTRQQLNRVTKLMGVIGANSAVDQTKQQPGE